VVRTVVGRLEPWKNNRGLLELGEKIWEMGLEVESRKSRKSRKSRELE
jgi:hypothetical protein